MRPGHYTLFLCAASAAIFSFFLGQDSAFSVDYRFEEEYTCLPERGVVELPGVKYDDLTPLAREMFNDNPTDVSNALYSLPLDKREEFIVLYLEPFARERHRAFFARCREVVARKRLDGVIDSRDLIPASLRQELQERERRRVTLHAGALPFRIGTKTVYVPTPDGYALDEILAANYVRDGIESANSAVFRKIDVSKDVPDTTLRRPIWARVNHVRETGDDALTMLRAYRTMVDSDWRATAVFPPDGFASQIEAVEYKWNLQPFNIRDNGFSYGQFTKTTNTEGLNQITYKATCIVVLPGCYVQASIVHETNTTLDNVNEINDDIAAWQSAILAANWD